MVHLCVVCLLGWCFDVLGDGVDELLVAGGLGMVGVEIVMHSILGLLLVQVGRSLYCL